MTPKRKWAAIAAGVAVALLIAASIFAVRLQPWARQALIQGLSERFNADVQLGDVRIRLIPWPRLSGDNLTIRQHGGPPMISIRRFTASVLGTKHLGTLTVEGLDVKLPAHREQSGSSKPKQASFKIDQVYADTARLATTPADPSKEPLQFDVHKMSLSRIGPGDAMKFHAELTNPKPRGLIVSDGTFGPWNAEDPSSSVIEGKYTFRDADLSVFKGISGILQSQGMYKGRLDAIEVHGLADVPDFALKNAGHKMRLHTEFSAAVDGTDGSTVLHDVQTTLGNSFFKVKGAIPRHQTFVFQANGKGGRLEDFLTLAMKQPKPVMTGAIDFESKVAIPPGDVDMLDKLELDGSYTLARVRFTSPETEQKISSLSHHAEGDPKNQATGTVAGIRGRFQLRHGTMRLPSVDFEVPGARVQLAGNYQMRGGALDFAGTATLDATVSEMTTGVKKILLKPIDPLFKKNKAGAVLPIKVSGTPGQPSFAFDIGRALRSK